MVFPARVASRSRFYGESKRCVGLCVVIALLIFVGIAHHDEPSTRTTTTFRPVDEGNTESSVKGWEADMSDMSQRCTRVEGCKCPDPTVPTDEIQKWIDRAQYQNHHENMVAEAHSAVVKSDVVFLGDSITEQWNGTFIGKPGKFVENVQTFQRLFTKAGGGEFDCIALGVAGDFTHNLLWHLSQGLLPDSSPRLYWILIGTNDLTLPHCSESSVVSGIVEIVKIVHNHSPSSRIVVNGLLPKATPNRENRDYKLGPQFAQILHINAKLQKIAVLNSDWIHYFDPKDLFLKTNEKQEVEFDSSLMRDWVHPNVMGMQAWGERIRQELKILLA